MKPAGYKAQELFSQQPVKSLLTIEPQDVKGTEYILEEEIFLGRDEECAIIIKDTFASHRHARIFLEENTLFLEDLTSTNGTFVNGEKIEKPCLLRQSDRIQIGNTILEAK
jgi:pSer/pThr/pTyr-binding forkhead associated (FHA) protein